MFAFFPDRKPPPLSILPPSLPFHWKQTHVCVTTDVFTAESSLDVGSWTVWPLEAFDLLPSTALGAEGNNLQVPSLQLQPILAAHFIPDHFLPLLEDLKIHTHTHTHTPPVKRRFRSVARCCWTSAVLPQAQDCRSTQGPGSRRGPLHCYRA